MGNQSLDLLIILFGGGGLSVLKHIRQNTEIDISGFQKAFATWADLTGLSRANYHTLREVLHLIKDDNGQTQV